MGIEITKRYQAKLMLNPIYIGSLLLLILNDIYLKPSFSNLLTGKLSDFSGVFCLAVFLYIVSANRVSRIFRARASFIISFGLLAIFQIPWVVNFVNSMLISLQFPKTSLTPDYTDLVVVIIYPAYFKFLEWAENVEIGNVFGGEYIFRIVFSVSLIWFVATSFTSFQVVQLNKVVITEKKEAEFFYSFEGFLFENGFELISLIKTDESAFLLIASKAENFENKYGRYTQELDWQFKFNLQHDNLIELSEIQLYAFNFKIEEPLADSLINKEFIKAFDVYISENYSTGN